MELPLSGIFILLGAFCAFLQSVIISISQDDIQQLIDKNPKLGNQLYKIKTNFSEELNSFLILELFFYSASAISLGYLSSNYHDPLMPVYFVPVFFVIVLVLRYFFYGLGRRFTPTFFPVLTPILRFGTYTGAPLLRINKAILRKIGGVNIEEASRQEITALVESARDGGSLDADEYRILTNIMHFSQVLVSDVMTPRIIVFALEADKTVGEVYNLAELQMYSRFPIFEGESLDHGVTGYCMTKDILLAALHGERDTKLRDLSREVYFIPDNAELDNALDRFLNRRQHLFVVVDEYGGVDGLLTMEDVLETMLGAEIVDEADRVVDLRLLAKQRRDKRVASLISPGE